MVKRYTAIFAFAPHPLPYTHQSRDLDDARHQIAQLEAQLASESSSARTAQLQLATERTVSVSSPRLGKISAESHRGVPTSAAVDGDAAQLQLQLSRCEEEKAALLDYISDAQRREAELQAQVSACVLCV